MASRQRWLRLISRVCALAILSVVLVHAWSGRNAGAQVQSCSACSATYYSALVTCTNSYNSCTQGEFICGLLYAFCQNDALIARDNCFTFCGYNPPGGGGGGGGGGATGKSPCQQQCYADRADCIANGGNPYVQDCINSGETVPFCCVQAFTECMDGCG